MPTLNDILYGDGPNVRPLDGLAALAAEFLSVLEAEQIEDGVWIVRLPEDEG